jgi:basic membrane lipoprotein Med (substrate-binding protein (PBP1-ABC) superfamily)
MVKNKKWHIKKIAALAGAAVLALSSAVLYAAPQVKAANGPCDTGDWAYAYINVRTGEDSSTTIFSSQGTNSIDGISYDRETNTLTLNNYKNKIAGIATNMMGDDFKINLIGDNEIGGIGSYGDAWGGSINICGNGSLVINADRAGDYGVAFFAEGTNSVLSVADTCNVTIYSGSKAVVYTSSNLTNRPIKDNGTLKENVTYNVSHPLEISRLYARYYEYDPYTTNTVYKNESDNTSLYYIKELTYVESGKVTYTIYKLTTKKALGDVYYADKIGEYDNIPAGYTKTTLENPISYYESDGGGTSGIAKDKIKVGVIHLSDPAEGSGYTYTHDIGIQGMQQNLGLSDSQIIRKNNISDTDEAATRKAIQECIDAGCNIIFTTSWGYMQTTADMAEEYPDVYFSHGTGYMSNGKNFNNYFGRIYQARYLSGIAAGLNTKTNKIGYVAAMGLDNSEVTGGIDAFALGIYSVNPDAKVYVKVTNSWYDPKGEEEAAKTLLNMNCDVIAQHCDTVYPQTLAQEKGVYSIGYNSDMSKEAPEACLCSVIWNWSAYYTSAVQSVIDGTWDGSNYYGGMNENLVSITPVSINN